MMDGYAYCTQSASAQGMGAGLRRCGGGCEPAKNCRVLLRLFVQSVAVEVVSLVEFSELRGVFAVVGCSLVTVTVSCQGSLTRAFVLCFPFLSKIICRVIILTAIVFLVIEVSVFFFFCFWGGAATRSTSMSEPRVLTPRFITHPNL